MDEAGQAYVADFGLALHASQQASRMGERSGSPAYMAPEQVRGETHLIDGRTDLWAIGVILYELLLNTRPFISKSQEELFAEILQQDPKPLRQLDRSIPKELERICLKCLEKRRSDRYRSAVDLQDDLRHWLSALDSAPTTESKARNVSTDTASLVETGELNDTDKDLSPVPVVPKGLRSFDEHDSEFFLQLLPGPRDRNGLPDSIRFWKNRIEEADADRTFRVGLIFGPSGCGKSSLVKAGLLPRLALHVLPIYVEATAGETEIRLLKSISKYLPESPTAGSLPELFQTMRERPIHNGKVLIVIDQFEQWLHARHSYEGELTDAFRQCDGKNLQCILMVRDDFWMPITRFFRDLEIRLVEDETAKSVDLFSKEHSEHVATRFGTAYGRFPNALSDEHRVFISKTIDGLAEEGKVICVRLALFCQMMQDKPWTPASLKAVGGTEGIGVTFLEEIFSSKKSSPRHRTHQRAARAVLEALLPDSGTAIKGGMKSRGDLMMGSGYEPRQSEFDELLQLLDSELRLLTPTDPEGQLDAHDDQLEIDHSQDYYQLTHDFLVPSLREWLTEKRKETRRGRAELRLVDLASLWKNKPEKRHLPSLLEFVNIRLLTNHKVWTRPQSQMMRKASRVHFSRGLVALMIGVVITLTGMFVRVRYQSGQAEMLVKSVLISPPTELLFAANELKDFARFAVTPLREAIKDETLTASQRFNAAFCLIELGGKIDAENICELLPSISDTDVVNIQVYRAMQELSDVRESIEIAMKNARREQNHHLTVRLAMLATTLRDTNALADVLAVRADPTLRSVFVHDVSPKWRTWLSQSANMLKDNQNPDVRSGIALAVGNISPKELPEIKTNWQGVLQDWYLNRRDSGTHSAASWALRSWKVPLPKPTEQDERFEWRVNHNGITLLKLRLYDEFTMETEFENNFTGPNVELSQDFWLSDREISVRQFKSYLKSEKLDWSGHDERVSPTDDHPIQRVDWFDAVRFCNWMSRTEPGRTECYKQDANGRWQIARKTNGYRLPTEAEWEYACRAGTTTPYSCGDIRYLRHYAVFNTVQAEVGGTRMCNAWGLFNMHGNVFEWCNDRSLNYQGYRGGCCLTSARVCRSASRVKSAPTYRNDSLGFRVALVPPTQPRSESTESGEAEPTDSADAAKAER